ncbi:hypothetical protein NEMIN01_2308 [Nematocida minor]|uniref:uncharacterized protein n=1 Tax=Nematocida minor TaxID=1912983 RepID=UPI0022210841|nr:uncharacterized protein NEMIN01_2308 [Nematocida minor]KAI5192948.1 hypothetical protein NEMIN01_2308 [Nematocida minor]
MLSTKSSPFAFSNALTRCLNLLESVKDSPPMLREVLAHIKRNRECVQTVMKILKQEETLRRHGKQKLFQMVFALWAAFPEMATPDRVASCLSTASESKLIKILLLKILISLVKQERIEADSALSAIEPHLFQGCVETDYLVLTAMVEILEKSPAHTGRVRTIRERMPEHLPVSLVPKIMQLALKTGFQYTIPLEAIGLHNTSAYIRILDTISVLGVVYPSTQLFSILPELTDSFKHTMSSFLQKQPCLPDYAIKNSRKIPFTNSLIIQKVKDILAAKEDDPAKIVEKLKKLLIC